MLSTRIPSQVILFGCHLARWESGCHTWEEGDMCGFLSQSATGSPGSQSGATKVQMTVSLP